MTAPVYIGDEVSAAGFRLAGLAIHTPVREDLFTDINSVCERASLVLLSSEFANRLADAQLQRLLARTTPPVLVIPDVRGQHPLADLATSMRQRLGVLE